MSEQDKQETDNETPKRKGSGDCLTPTTTIALLLLAIATLIGKWVLA